MNTRRVMGTLALAGLAWWSTTNGVRADDAAGATLQQLEQKVRIVERKLEIAEENATAKAKEAPTFTAGASGFGLYSPDKAFGLRLRGDIQADARFFVDDEAGRLTDSFLVRRARVTFDVNAGKSFALRIQPDFGGSSPQLLDAYVDYKKSEAFNLRFGRAKAPIGLERLQSSTDTLFNEDGFSTALTPNRVAGLQAYGSLGKGVIEYQLGVFNGVIDGDNATSDTDDDKSLAARVWLSPFKNTDATALKGLSFGVAGSIGTHTGTTNAPGLASYRSSGQSTFFSYRTSATNSADTAIADGDSTRIAPQFYYAAGPIGILGEYVLSEQEVANGKGSASLENEAWQLATSWVLTGETPSLRGLNPARPFDPAKGQWGAFELKARIGELSIDDEAFSGGYAQSSRSAKSAESIGVGLNWYPTRNTRFSLDYEQTSFDGGATSGDRPEEKVVIARAQVAF